MSKRAIKWNLLIDVYWKANPTVTGGAAPGRKEKNAGIKKIYPIFPGLKAKKKWGMFKISFHYPLPIVECHVLYIKRPHI